MARFDWRHINPVTGMPRVIDNPEDKIELMSRMPSRSGYYIFLQNRVNLNSVGNRRSAKKMWFDAATATVSSDESMDDAVHFKAFVLPGAGKPAGWLRLEDAPAYLKN